MTPWVLSTSRLGIASPRVSPGIAKSRDEQMMACDFSFSGGTGVMNEL